ncbi:hypothetical protein RYO59_001379 [Thermosynechococcaceae cyanobacterium Okahandja]
MNMYQRNFSTGGLEDYTFLQLFVEIDNQIKKLEHLVRYHTGEMPKYKLLKLAKELGWQIQQGRGKHPTKAVCDGFKVPIPGHGKGATLHQGLVHDLLKQLTEPKLAELRQQKQEYLNRFLTLLKDKELQNCTVQLNEQQEQIYDLMKEVQSLKQDISQLHIQLHEANNTANTAEALLLEREQYWSEMTQKARLEAQKSTEQYLYSQLVLEDVLQAFQELQDCFSKIDNYIRSLPPQICGPLPKYLDEVHAIFARDIILFPASEPLQELDDGSD